MHANDTERYVVIFATVVLKIGYLLSLLKCHFSLSKVSSLMINICPIIDSLGNTIWITLC